jgi:hypothetical protein
MHTVVSTIAEDIYDLSTHRSQSQIHHPSEGPSHVKVKGGGSGAKSSLLHNNNNNNNNIVTSLSNQSPKQQQQLFKDKRSPKKNRPSLIKQLDIGDGALLSHNAKLNLPQIGSMKQIKLAKDMTVIGSGSPSGSIHN